MAELGYYGSRPASKGLIVKSGLAKCRFKSIVDLAHDNGAREI